MQLKQLEAVDYNGMNAKENLTRQLGTTVSKIVRQLDKSGVQLPADILAYKSFRKRETIENKLIRKVGDVQRAQLGHIMELLGDPPRVENLTKEFWDTAAKELVAAIQPLLVEAQIEQAREMIDDNPAIGVDWAALNQEAIDQAREYTFDLVKGINETSKELLQSAVSGYFENDTTIGQLEAQLLEAGFGPVRAEMIAVTEVTRAASMGEQEVLDQLREQGIEMEATWETNDDEFVCDICGPLDGETNDYFNDNGEPIWTHPESGEEMGAPPAHPRCRCWWTSGFKEEK